MYSLFQRHVQILPISFIENVEQASGADCTYLYKHKNIQFYIHIYIYINSIYTSLRLLVMGIVIYISI